MYCMTPVNVRKTPGRMIRMVNDVANVDRFTPKVRGLEGLCSVELRIGFASVCNVSFESRALPWTIWQKNGECAHTGNEDDR